MDESANCAGSRAFERSANRAAVVWFEQTLTALQQMPQDQRTIDYLVEAQTLARNLGDRRREGWVASHLAYYYVNTGDPVRAIEVSRRALTAATAVADTAIEASTNFYLSRAYNALGEYVAAAAVSRRNVELLDRGANYAHYFNLPMLSRCAWASRKNDCNNRPDT